VAAVQHEERNRLEAELSLVEADLAQELRLAEAAVKEKQVG